MAAAKGTYVYCVIAAARRPRLARVPPGLPGTGRVRLLDVEPGLFMAVADAPLDRYGEAAITRGLGDLDWVSRAAVAHEAVIESFVGETAVLPMKLFTIFTGDERAVAHVRAERARIAGVVRRVSNHQEWGVRVVLDRARAAGAAKAKRAARASAGDGRLAGNHLLGGHHEALLDGQHGGEPGALTAGQPAQVRLDERARERRSIHRHVRFAEQER